jgi:hypothetical protein
MVRTKNKIRKTPNSILRGAGEGVKGAKILFVGLIYVNIFLLNE